MNVRRPCTMYGCTCSLFSARDESADKFIGINASLIFIPRLCCLRGFILRQCQFKKQILLTTDNQPIVYNSSTHERSHFIISCEMHFERTRMRRGEGGGRRMMMMIVMPCNQMVWSLPSHGSTSISELTALFIPKLRVFSTNCVRHGDLFEHTQLFQFLCG